MFYPVCDNFTKVWCGVGVVKISSCFGQTTTCYHLKSSIWIDSESNTGSAGWRSNLLATLTVMTGKFLAFLTIVILKLFNEITWHYKHLPLFLSPLNVSVKWWQVSGFVWYHENHKHGFNLGVYLQTIFKIIISKLNF